MESREGALTYIIRFVFLYCSVDGGVIPGQIPRKYFEFSA